MSTYEDLCRILNFERAWAEGCEVVFITVGVISSRFDHALGISVELGIAEKQRIVEAIRRLACAKPEFVIQVNEPWPVPKNGATPLWSVRSPWKVTSSGFGKNEGANFIEYALEEESRVWLNELRKINARINALSIELKKVVRKKEDDFVWPVYGIWTVVAGWLLYFFLVRLKIIPADNFGWVSSSAVVVILVFCCALVKMWDLGLPAGDPERVMLSEIEFNKKRRNMMMESCPTELIGLTNPAAVL